MAILEMYIKVFGEKEKSRIYFENGLFVFNAGNGVKYSGKDLNQVEERICQSLAIIHLQRVAKKDNIKL